MIRVTKFFLCISLLFVFHVFSVYGRKPSFRERVYVQTDKPFYLAGETMWFKTVTTDKKGVPVDFSKIVYLELLGDSTSVYKTMIDVRSGQAGGMIKLPGSLPGGMYRLCAYTRNMQSEGEPVFFNKPVGIVNLLFPEPVSADHPKIRIDKNYSKAPERKQNAIRIECDSVSFGLRAPVKLTVSGLPENLYSLGVSVSLDDRFVSVPGYDISEWRSGLGALSDVNFAKEVVPEYEGHIVQGMILDDETNKPVSKQANIRTVLAFPGKGISVFPGQAGSNGKVRFFTTDIAGTTELVVSASEVTDTAHRYRVDIIPPYAGHSSRKPEQLILGNGWEDACSIRLLSQQLQEALRDSLSTLPTSGLQFKPGKIYRMEEYTKFSSVKDIIYEYIQDVFVYNGRIIIARDKIGDGSQNTLILFDGVPVLNPHSVLQYNTKQLKSIAVYGDRYILGGAIYDGIVSFTSLARNFSGLQLKAGTQLFDYMGPLAPQVFIAPVYDDKTKKTSRLPDFRTTLYWNPDAKVSGDGGNEIMFYTSDIPGQYEVRIEGLCTDGSVVTGQCFLSVR